MEITEIQKSEINQSINALIESGESFQYSVAYVGHVLINEYDNAKKIGLNNYAEEIVYPKIRYCMNKINHKKSNTQTYGNNKF